MTALAAAKVKTAIESGTFHTGAPAIPNSSKTTPPDCGEAWGATCIRAIRIVSWRG